MPFEKGNKLGGRKEGSRNKDVLELEDRAKALGVDVFEIMVKFVAGDWEGLGYEASIYVSESADGKSTKLGYTISPEMRLQAGKELMKYIYTQKRALDISSNPVKDALDISPQQRSLGQLKAIKEAANKELELVDQRIAELEKLKTDE